MPEVVKAKTAVPIRDNHSGLHRGRSEVTGHEHVGNARPLPFQPERRENPIARLPVRRLLHPRSYKISEQWMHWNGRLRSFAFRKSRLAPGPGSPNADQRFGKADILPLQAQDL